MKNLLTISILLFTGVLSARTWTRINPIVGDQSYILKYGKAPNETTSDQVRIATHLEYAEFVLRSKDVSGMSEEQVSKRNHLLDLLHAYFTRGIFPVNDDETDERRPCFIDHEGTICAVGYLIEQTAGHEVAELVSERFRYNEILEMNDPVVLNWIQECGLTQEECAMIQPGYGPRFVREPQLSYGVSYRIQDNFYHSFGFHLLKYQAYGFRSAFHGDLISSSGIRFDLLNNGNFSAGIRYAKTVGQRKRFGTLGIMPECFRYNNVWGMNLKPEFGLYRTWKFFEFGVAYSYAIPIISESAYGAGRHDITARVGLNFTDLHIKIPKKPKPAESSTDTPAG